MYFPHAYKKTFFIHGTNGITGNALTPASSGASSALLPGQLGVFNSGVGNALTYSPTQASAAAPLTTGAPFYLAMGSWYKTGAGFTSADKIGSHGGYQESVKSKIINPRYISRVIQIAAKGAKNQVIKIQVATANTAAGLPLENTYRLRIDAKGAPALRFLNHQLYRTLDYYAPANTTNPTYLKDPIWALLSWKDQINSNPLTSAILQARVYKYAATSAASITTVSTVSTTSATLPLANTTGVVLGQKVTNGTSTGIPANSFVTAFSPGVSVTITYPPQGLAPTIGVGTILFWTEQFSTGQDKNTVFIPGTSVTTGLANDPTAAVAPDQASGSFTSYTAGQEPHLEISAAYYDTVFGNATFTPVDYYNLEPINIQASMVDETGLPSGSVPVALPLSPVALGTTALGLNMGTGAADNLYFGTHGIEVQRPTHAIGLGEGIMRDLILSGRYQQEAYPDSSRVESFRMREVEQNPVFTSASGVSRSAYYNQLLIVHSVPRFSNANGLFDTDQYVIQIVVPQTASTTTFANAVVSAATNAQGGVTAITLENTY